MLDKDVTIYDIASLLNISPSTVSRGLKNDPIVKQATRETIFKLANQMNYRRNNFASRLTQQGTQTLGVIIPRIDSNQMSNTLAGIEEVANSYGYNLLLCQSQDSAKKEKANADQMYRSRVDGLLVSLAADSDHTRQFNTFFEKEIPVVFFDQVPMGAQHTSIFVNHFEAAYDATTHLIEDGCEDIVHISAASKNRKYIEILEGYKAALAHHNLRFIPEAIIHNNLTYGDGLKSAERIQQMARQPDGVFSAGDQCAIGCMKGLLSMGIRVPEQVSFIGYDNDPTGLIVSPNLSTIRYPAFEMGVEATRNILQVLAGGATTNHKKQLALKHSLIVRASSQRRSTA